MSLPRRFSALRKILDATDVHIVITNPDGRIIYANAAAENHTGFMIAEMIGKKPGELWGGKMPKDFYDTMWHAIADEKRPFTESMRNCRKNGEPYWQEVHILPVLNSAGKVECYLGIEFDRDAAAEQSSFQQLSNEKQFLSLNVRWPREWEEDAMGGQGGK